MRAERIGDLATNQAVSAEVPWYRQIFSDLSKALPGLATTYLSIEQQRALSKINLQRAQLGQPAIAVEDYASPGVNVGVSRSTQNTILLVAAGIGVVILLSNSGRGRRR